MGLAVGLRQQVAGWAMSGAAAGGRGGGSWGPGRGGAGGLRRGCSPPAPAGSPRAGLQPLRATVPFQLQQPHQRRDGGGRAGEPGRSGCRGEGLESTGRSMKGKWMGGEGREKGTRRVPRTEGARRAAANVGCNSGKEGAWSPR